MPDMTLQVPATYQPLTIPLGVRCGARRTPGKVALIEAGRTRSYAELCERMTRLHWLALAELDHVARAPVLAGEVGLGRLRSVW